MKVILYVLGLCQSNVFKKVFKWFISDLADFALLNSTASVLHSWCFDEKPS